MGNVIVVGCGRVGSQLANMLSDNGANVYVIDVAAESFANLGRGFNGTKIQGIGFDESTLISAGVEDCTTLAAVTSSDNTNLMVAEVAKHLFGVPHVITRLFNPQHERAYMQLGLDFVCGTSLVAEQIYSKVISGHGFHLDALGEIEILKFSLDLSTLKRKDVKVSDLERDHTVRIVAFERADGSTCSIPTKDSVLHHGDTVIAAVSNTFLRNFARFIQD